MASAAKIEAPNPRWHETLEAKAILASIKANPPRHERRSQVYAITRDDWHVYVGKRVDRLKELREIAGEDCLATGGHVFDEWAAVGTVHDVIDAALAEVRA